MFVRVANRIMSIDRIISELHRHYTVYMSIYDRQVIAQAFIRSPIQTNPIALAEEAYSWPQLFLYSNSDTLIPASVSFHPFLYANFTVTSWVFKLIEYKLEYKFFSLKRERKDLCKQEDTSSHKFLFLYKD